MTLSSAEKNSGINPWVFPDVKEDIIFPEFQEQVSSSRPSDKYRSEAQSPYSPPIHQTSVVEADRQSEPAAAERRGDETDGGDDMGNVSPTAKGSSPTGCNPLMSPEKKHVQHQNELNSRQRQYQTLPSQYINGNCNKDMEFSDTNSHIDRRSGHKNGGGQTPRTTSPAPVGTEKIRLTMDVNNSRPTSRSSTPVLTRKAAIRDGSHTSTPTPTNTSSSTSSSSAATTADQNRSNSSSSLKDSQAKDIMISYSHLDKEIMLKLKDALEAHHISVWVDVVGLNAGVNFLNKIGQAIIDSKMFITLLTERTVASKFCQDELALAYISNKPIFPVSIQPQAEIFPKIPTGMKLQLARFEWTQISVDNFDRDIGALLTKLKACLDDVDGVREEGRDEVGPLSPTTDMPLQRKPVLRKRVTRSKIYHRPNRSLSRCNSIIEQTEDIDACAEFWDRNFGEEKCVQWDSFEGAFMKDYEKQLNMTYASSDREWFIDILKRELEVEQGIIHKDKYKEFISEEWEGKIKEQPILKCVNDLAVENYTMKEVFNMDSSVRLDAINNLAKFGSVAVVEALLDLLDDQEHDVRASACISLAKSKAGDLNMKIDRLMRCLRDTDRFVRESACIALGYLKADNAVPPLLQIWRNDYISSVRDAAELALQQIGGEQVNRAMQMTKVLTAEIEDLIKVLTGKTTSPKSGGPKKWGQIQYSTLPAGVGFGTSNSSTASLNLAPAPARINTTYD